MLFKLGKLPYTQALVFMAFQFNDVRFFRGMVKSWNNGYGIMSKGLSETGVFNKGQPLQIATENYLLSSQWYNKANLVAI